MNWNETLGVFLVGGFVVYLIAAGHIDDYLSFFVSSGPAAASTNSGGLAGMLPSWFTAPGLSGLTGGLL